MGKMEQGKKRITFVIDVGFIRSYNVYVANAYDSQKGKKKCLKNGLRGN